MAEKVGDVYVELGVKDGNFAKKMGAAQNRVTGLGSSLKKLGALAAGAFAARGLLRGMGEVINLSSRAEETANKFGVTFADVFGQASGVVDELRSSYGLAGSQAQQFLADTGDLLSGFGFAQDASLELAEQVAKLGVDLASFTNIEGGAAKAVSALTRLLVGETEPAKALGIVVRQDTKEFKDLVAQLQRARGFTLLQAKATAALTIATSQSKNAIGDYQRTSESLANQTKLLGDRWKELKEALGGAIRDLFGVDDIVPKITQKIGDLAGAIQGLLDTNFFKAFAANIKAEFQSLVIDLGKPFKLLGELIGTTAFNIQDFFKTGGKNFVDPIEQGVKTLEELDKLQEDLRRDAARAGALGPREGFTSATPATSDGAGGAATQAARRQAVSFVGFEQAIKSIQTSPEQKEALQNQRRMIAAEERSVGQLEQLNTNLSTGTAAGATGNPLAALETGLKGAIDSLHDTVTRLLGEQLAQLLMIQKNTKQTALATVRAADSLELGIVGP